MTKSHVLLDWLSDDYLTFPQFVDALRTYEREVAHPRAPVVARRAVWVPPVAQPQVFTCAVCGHTFTLEPDEFNGLECRACRRPRRL